MTTQHDNAPADSPIDRRVFLGATGALALAGGSAMAEEKSPSDTKEARRLSDTIADFVAGLDLASLPPLAIERTRLAFVERREAKPLPETRVVAQHSLVAQHVCLEFVRRYFPK